MLTLSTWEPRSNPVPSEHSETCCTDLELILSPPALQRQISEAATEDWAEQELQIWSVTGVSQPSSVSRDCGGNLFTGRDPRVAKAGSMEAEAEENRPSPVLCLEISSKVLSPKLLIFREYVT